MPAVAIDVPADLPAPEVAAVVQSCSAALGEGRCIVAWEAQPRRWVAVVRFADDGTTLRVELRADAADGELVAESALEFERQDPARQRWAAAGLVVASLVAAELSDAERADAPAPTRPPRRSAVASAPRPAPSRSRLWGALDVGALLGPGLDQGPLRFGAHARVLGGWQELPVLFVVSGRYATAQSTPRAQWFTVGVGVGTRFGAPDGSFGAELRSEVLLERAELTAVSSDGWTSETQAVGRIGTSLGVCVSFRVHPRLALFVDGEFTLKRPELSLEVEGRRENGEHAARGVAAAGLRLPF